MLRLSAALLLACGCAVALSPVATMAHAAQADIGQASPATIRAMVADRMAATVIVKFLLKGDESGMGDQETEVIGTMIDGKGLVLVSNTSMGGMMARFMGGAVQPSDIKVLIGDDTKGVEAKLIARDSELDLAWIQIDEPRAEGYAHLDISKNPAQAADVGDFLYTVTKGGKFYDRTPIARELRMVGRATKPRDLMLVGSEGFGGFGMPVFNAKGECIGITALILPSEEEMENARDLFGDTPSFAILPLSEVAKATASARESATKADAAAPAPTDTPATAPKTEPADAPAGDAAPAPAPATAPANP
jgi:S1-C subfamily serine protease